MKQRWTFRAYPTFEQTQHLARTFGCVRHVWNWALHLRSDAYRTRQELIGYAETDRRLTQLKHAPETAWLQEVSCVPLQQALRDLQMAFVNFFDKRAAYPQFKKKSRRQSANYTKSGFSFDQTTRTLSLAKLGPLKIRWSREAVPMPSSVRVIKTTTGKYFVSLVVDTTPIQWPKSGASVGLDFGIMHLATLSTGDTIQNPRHAERQQRRLTMLQRRLAKKQKGSRRRADARHRVAILHERIRNARQDALHKLTTTLVKRFDTIYLEDLNVRGMGQNHSLARCLSDAAIGMARRLLAIKAARYGKTVVTIDRFFPSSKRCSACGHVLDALPLAIRSWECPSCGTTHDRDVNAAKNILAVGQTVAAHGAGRRPHRVLRRGTRRRSANHPERLATV
jgi:putative transposase